MATRSSLKRITPAGDDPRSTPAFIGYRSPIVAAAILLGIYVAMYLLVATIVHVVAPLEAAAVVSSTPAAGADSRSARDAAAVNASSAYER